MCYDYPPASLVDVHRMIYRVQHDCVIVYALPDVRRITRTRGVKPFFFL